MALFVQPTGTRSWIRRLVIRGRRRGIGLGSLTLVPLFEAREKALANRKLARPGGGPLLEKRDSQGIPTLAEAAVRVVKQKQADWRNRKHARERLSSLRRMAFPRIGKMPVSEVNSADVLEILTPIWHRKAETARRVRQRIGTVMKWAIAQGYRMDNPAGEALGAALPKQGGIQPHFKALPDGEVAAAIRTVRQSGAAVAVKLGFQFLVLTACRSGEMRGGRRST